MAGAYEQSPCLFALHATAKLGAAVAAALDRPLAAHEEREFEDGEHKIRPLETVRGADVFVLQSLHGEAEQSATTSCASCCFSSPRSRTVAPRASPYSRPICAMRAKIGAPSPAIR